MDYTIPTIIEGQQLQKPAAVDHFFKTGEHLGKHSTPKNNVEVDALDAYDTNIHKRQAKYYNQKVSELGNAYKQSIKKITRLYWSN